MRTFDLFVVEIEKPINDTITTKSGLELYIDNRFKEFDNRVNEGPVVATPFKYDTGVAVGDTLYFHHHVVINGGQPLTGNENHYLVRWNESTVSNQAIAYRKKDTSEVIPLGGWSVFEELPKEEAKKTDSGLELVSLKDKPVTKARLAFDSEGTRQMGLAVGDVCAFRKNIDYRFKIDGKEYIRIPESELLYVEVPNG